MHVRQLSGCTHVQVAEQINQSDTRVHSVIAPNAQMALQSCKANQNECAVICEHRIVKIHTMIAPDLCNTAMQQKRQYNTISPNQNPYVQ